MPSLQKFVTSLLLAGSALGAQVAANQYVHHGERITPKVFIVSMVCFLRVEELLRS